MGIIEVEGLRFTYSGSRRPALDGIDLSIRKGEFVILTGPSGCGKTTFCRCLNGLIPHFYPGDFEGRVVVAGLDTREHEIWELAQHVGLVFQNPENQLFCLTVEADVAFGPENLGLPRDEIRRRVDWALKATGMWELRDRAPHELSGGQQQRAAIASVLAMEPDILVLDEPTSFLDPAGAAELISLISDLNKSLGMTVVLVEHRLDLASAFSDRVIIMDRGRVALDGPPEEVLTDPRASGLGIGIPKVVKLYELLADGGLKLPKVPLSPPELADLVAEVA
ncbi:ABC transporter ATP-binding protein [Candidatus Bathyarchaeota archaeon]|nr:MAG: ABC transporter ATP-binding protein [Candidatus Bathyarchaeota archaeon]